jgi:4'-phosphopantetheinyl transferase
MTDGIHIWRAALDEAGWPGAEPLPAPERERAAAFLREEPRRRWVAARWALRRVLAEYLDGPAAEIELEVGEGGKPRLRRGGGVEFNLSHSGGLALVAVTWGCEIGVDVEIEEPGRDLVALAERVLPSESAAAVREAPPSERGACFYAAWTRHEARLKCAGAGLGGGASPPSFPPEGQDRRLASPAVENLDLAPGYAAAVAVAAPEVGSIEYRSLRAG